MKYPQNSSYFEDIEYIFMGHWYIMLYPLIKYFMISNLVESFVDNVIRDSVQEPAIGSIVYCDLLFGTMEHSGVYVGDDKIVALERTGLIRLVTPKQFIAGGTAISIYTSCNNGVPVGRKDVATRARKMINSKRHYNVLSNNCHQFSAGCLSGDFENANHFLWMLKLEAKQYLKADEWRTWHHQPAVGGG